jgi:integrase
MPYKHGRGYWGWVPGQDGGKKRVSLGTSDLKMARAIEALMRHLAGKREWVLLGAALDGRSSPGELYDHALKGEQYLEDLRGQLSAVDLNQYVESWQNWARRRASASTVARYLVQLRALIPADVAFPSSHFTRKRINEALQSLPVSGSTGKRYHAGWSSFGRYLVEIEVLDANPMRSVTPPRDNPPRELYLSLEDSKRLVEAQPEPYRSIAALREGAGVEISAALTVLRRDVDELNRTVHVHGTKNASRSRLVGVEDWAWRYVIAAAKGKLPNASVFVEEDGRPATYYRALSAHRAAVKALKLPEGYRMHDSRHSFAVRCMKGQIEPQRIAQNLGHRDATMVLRVYGKYQVSGEDIRRARTGTGGL